MNVLYVSCFKTTNPGNLVVYVAQTLPKLCIASRTVLNVYSVARLIYLYRIRENSQIRSRDGHFNYTIILCAGAPLPPNVSKQN
jgi:hypothetical protein